METLVQDVRYAVRGILRKPGFAVVATITLALGIGANAAIFSVIDAVLLRPLPYPEPDRIVKLWELEPEGQQRNVDYNFSPANFFDVRDQNESFEQVAYYGRGAVSLTGAGDPQRLTVAWTSANFLEVVGVEPLVGRGFAPGEDQPGSDRMVLLSEGFWRRHFGGDSSVVGQPIRFDGESFTVIGVLPGYVEFPETVDAWVSLGIDPETASKRAVHFLGVAARLRSGVTLEEARAEMSALAGRLEREYPQTNAGRGFNVETAQEHAVGDIRPALLTLLAAVGLVLLIACANVANLLLARATSRQKEIAVRAALGAGRGRLVRQFLTESVILSLLGSAAGVLIAVWGKDLLVALGPKEVARLSGTSLDHRVLLFTVGVSLLTGIVFGLVPALQASKPDLNDALKDGGRGGAGLARTRTRGALVVFEVAVSLVLLAGAGLLVRSFVRVLSVDPGFDPRNVLTMQLSLPESKYGEASQTAAFYQQLQERIAALPSVRYVGVVNSLPLSASGATAWMHVEGRPNPPDVEPPEVGYRVAGGDYFRVMGIPLLQGRAFSTQDSAEATPAALVNETLARAFWPGEDPLGRRFKLGPNPEGGSWITVVGVVGDVRHSDLESAPRPEAFLAHAQESWSSMTVVLKVDGDPSSLVAAVTDQVRSMDPDQPVFSVRTMEEVRAASVAGRRFSMALLAGFAGLALVMAAVGLYGVISYSVAQRTHEIGIRMALGAKAGDVLRLVVRQGLGLVGMGVAAGLVAAYALTRFLEGMLFGVSPTDPATFAGIAALLVGVALLASYVPARRAARVDPMVALRHE
jgi:putative ABC transport system permease protein